MNVVVPYVALRDELVAALEGESIPAEFVDTSAPDGYWSLLAERWARGETFVVLEQDKIPEPGAIRDLWNCERDWCTYPVPMRDSSDPSPYPSLACTKFGAALMTADPDLMQKVGELDLGLGLREWSRLDLAIAALCENIVACHWHEAGRVAHWH